MPALGSHTVGSQSHSFNVPHPGTLSDNFYLIVIADPWALSNSN